MGKSGEVFGVRVEEVQPYVPMQGTVEEGTKLITFLIYLQNVSAKEQSYRTGQWKLYDKQGFVYEPVGSGSLRAKPDLPEGFLMPQGEVRGWVTFQVPVSMVPHKIQFFQGYISGGAVDFLVPDNLN